MEKQVIAWLDRLTLRELTEVQEYCEKRIDCLQVVALSVFPPEYPWGFKPS